MSGSMIVMALLKLFLGFGFAYIIWTLAVKENASLKLIGQIVSVAIIVLVVLGVVAAGHRHMMGGYMMKPFSHEMGSGTGTDEGMGMQKKSWHRHDHKGMKSQSPEENSGAGE